MSINVISNPSIEAAIAVGDYIIGHRSRLLTDILLIVDTIYYVPIYVPQNTNIDRVSIDVTELESATNIRVGIYADDQGKPGVLLSNSGALSGASQAVVEATVDLFLTRGLWWGAVWPDTGSGTLRLAGTAVTENAYFFGTNAAGGAVFASATSAEAYGATLPDPAETLIPNTLESPCVSFRVA